MKRLKSFTLIELLVVVAIIAVLVAILLPALQRARETAQTAVCMSNERQMGVAISMYVEDIGWFPVQEYGNGNEERHIPTILKRTNYLADYSVWLCPASGRTKKYDDWWSGGPDDDPPDFTHACYGYNHNFFHKVLVWHTWTTCPESAKLPDSYFPANTVYSRAEKQLSQIVMIADSWFILFDDKVYVCTAPPYDIYSRVRYRHNGNHYANILCADGHVEQLEYWDYDGLPYKYRYCPWCP